MASNINPNNIDGTYPIAGQDNDSQGFRDNFTNISNNFAYAQAEISDLQSKVVVTSALNGSTVNNDFAGTPIIAAQLRGCSETIIDHGFVSGNTILDFSAANEQKFQTSGSVTLGFTGWPIAPLCATMKIWIGVNSPSHTVTFPVTSPGVTYGKTEIAGMSTSGVVTFDAAGQYLFELKTFDGGQNIIITDLTRNAKTMRDPNFYFNKSVDPTMWIGFNGNLSQARSSENFPSVVRTFGSMSSLMVGNLSQGSIDDSFLDSTTVSGYHIDAARGNLQANVIQAVEGNDYLGSIQTRAFTGNGTANIYQTTSSIGFYSTGSNVVNGLGGNIAFFTAKDGINVVNGVRNFQAMSIENDQSTRFFGNVVIAGSVPTSATAAGIAGQIAYDSSYFYVCVATNTWVRTALTTW